MNSPTPTRARPDPASTRPVGRHRVEDSATSATASWRRALTGEIRLAATAGSRDATHVTPVPTTRHTTMVCHPTTNPAADVCAPWLVMVPRRIAAAARPRHSPTPEARKPRAAASPSTERYSCDRDAPMQRSRASSLRRCATRMLMMLKITSAPTKRAIPRTTSRIVVNFGAPVLLMAAIPAVKA